ncbi:ATP-dependent DNA helicase RecQ [Agrobacterium rubi]|nr:ATP-dependent DNA helicase RecQ [Agrobacterium rubi]NTF23878.1 ATP-dependent DNA helicase RecQ [Agrobacterium rubi]
MRAPVEVLRNVFGHEDFRDLQGDVVNHVCEGGSALVLFPTGKGKSLCYQIPAICREGVGIVVSPLLSLMRDQLTKLEEKGVVAVTINSDTKVAERREIEEALKMGQIDLLYVTPEQVATARFKALVKEIEVSVIGVDEAHCVVEFGSDFRPDYNSLSILRTILPDVPVIAATASADQETVAEIISRLDIDHARIFQSSFDRANIHYSMEFKSKKPREQMLSKLDLHKGESGIVYCIGRNTVDKTAEWLCSEGYSALPYHAGMKPSDRSANQDAFISGEVDIIVATVAFGMGIDKADVRYVLHTDMPTGVEAFYQESGRAGRDGLPAKSYVFYGNANVVQRQRMIKKSKGGVVVKRTGQAKLDAQIGVLETAGCRRKAILHYFGEAYGLSCGNCDNCDKVPATRDATAEANVIVDVVRKGTRLTAYEIVGQACNVSPRSKTDDSWAVWSSVVRQMVASGILDVSYGHQAEITLNPTVEVPLPEGSFKVRAVNQLTSAKVRSTGKRRASTAGYSKAGSAGARSKSASSRSRVNPHEVDENFGEGMDLVSALRKKRKQLAIAAKVKEYFVLHNASLEEMARVMPRNGSEMLQIPGIGQKKLEQYGGVFLGVINRFAA